MSSRAGEVFQGALETKAGNEEFCCSVSTAAIAASYEDPQGRTGLGLTGPPVDLSPLLAVSRQQVRGDTGELEEGFYVIFIFLLNLFSNLLHLLTGLGLTLEVQPGAICV